MVRLVAVVLVLGITACGGGGGSGGGPSDDGTVPFTTVSAIEPGQAVRPRQGLARQLTTWTDDGKVDQIMKSALRTTSLVATFDDAGELVAVRTGSYGINLESTRPEIERRTAAFDPRFLVFVRAGKPLQPKAIIADPNAAGLEHLMFGVWQNPLSGKILDRYALLTATAQGTITPAAAVPAAGTASYQGAATGFLVTADGAVRDVSAEVTLAADFAAQSLAFTSGAAQELETSVLRPELATTGTLAIDSNRFSGTGTAANGWRGPIDGRFFGPEAEEAGGVLELRGGSRVERYVAAFGAAQ